MYHVGELPGFGRVYYSPDCMANILYFHDLASKELISFDKEKTHLKSSYLGRIVISYPRESSTLSKC